MRRAVSYRLLRLAAIGAALAALSLLSSCGGGDSDPTTTAAGSGGEGGGEAGSASVRSFGEEAPPGDRAPAASAVREFLRARAAGDAAKECSLLAASTKETLAGFGGGLAVKDAPCPELVTALTSQIKPKALEQPGRIQVTGMRIDDDRGFVLYRDSSGAAWAFAVVREGSAWRIGGIRGYPLE
jgi:hypothetical protein